MQHDTHTDGYDDIMELPYPAAFGAHARMAAQDRAAQFSPFAALTGLGAVIAETGRLTEERVELDEYEKAALNDALCALKQCVGERPVMTMTYFCPDEKKNGGAYVTVTDAVKRIKAFERVVVLAGGETIAFDDIVAIRRQ